MKNDKFKGREKGQSEEDMLPIAVKKTQYEIEIRLKSIWMTKNGTRFLVRPA